MSTTTLPSLRSELPPLPSRMTRLKIDHRGYPVPWFVTWLDDEQREVRPGEGQPDFRIVRATAIGEALQFERCWICGEQLGRYKAFVLGPMCVVNRINSEPPSHTDCADFAARACPFLSRPHMVRRDNNMPEGLVSAPGVAIDRNPKAAVVWITDKPFTIRRVTPGILFDLPEPSEVRMYAEGRPATRAEIQHSIDTGLPQLLDLCQNEEEQLEVYALAERAMTKYAPQK